MDCNHIRPRCGPWSQGEDEGLEAAADRLLLCVLSQPIGAESVSDGHSRPPEHRFPGEAGRPSYPESVSWMVNSCASRLFVVKILDS